MKRLNTLGALLGGALLLGALALPAATLAADKSKMVIQVSENDPATWNLALNNARNIQKDMGKDNVELEIVAFGPGINMLKAESEVANRIGETVDSGVSVMACQNTMRNQKLDKEDMHAKVGYVASGVVEIMQRQKQGYTYLRP
ncbi:DsrE family protein [Thiobacillus denitrificans]|jgi:intracellular sulfur oxidation DsrE/DsrF family protein|uniref:DsrE family protein n=1 Tax=Thiobacillus denitrificans TaxID=36861 RepID=UPI00036DD97C|nr:DsrE family protein [Thiobacillus denitrificans]